jgi:guanylate kinase
MNTGTLYIIAAPSGAGKTSLVKQLAATLDNLTVSISHTTRLARPGEVNGEDYYFVSIPEFEAMLINQAFLEYAQVFDNFYGTAQQTVAENLAQGLDVILEIDWQGAQQIKAIFPSSISIFILPPSTEVLRQRLKNRAQDDDSTIARRMRDAVTEMRHHDEFDYLIVNDVFEQALTELKSILICHRLTQQKQRRRLNILLTSLLLDS